MAVGAVQVACFKTGVGRGKLFSDRLLARFLQSFLFLFFWAACCHILESFSGTRLLQIALL